MTKEIAQTFAAYSKRLLAVEKQLSDYTEALNSKRQGDIDYLAMQAGVDLDIGEEEITEGGLK